MGAGGAAAEKNGGVKIEGEKRGEGAEKR